jgi:hypothetical protein
MNINGVINRSNRRTLAMGQGKVKRSERSGTACLEVGGAALRALRSASLEAIRDRHDTVPTYRFMVLNLPVISSEVAPDPDGCLIA